jgi:heptosyltransferase-2
VRARAATESGEAAPTAGARFAAQSVRVLVVAPSWIGDTVLAQPLFMRLHAAHSGLEIDVLAPPWTAPLLARMPEVHAVLDNPFRHGELKVFARRRLGLTLRQRRYQRAIVLPNTFKSALPAFFASIPQRTGYRGELRAGLLNDVRRLDARRLPLLVERYAALAEAAGRPLPHPLPRPHLHVDEANRARVTMSLALSVARPVVVFCPGAEYGEAKRWPVAHFRSLAARTLAAGFQLWIMGSANDQPTGAAIAAGFEGSALKNLCGHTSLADAVDLLSLAALVVTNDSGLMHVAAALDRPMIALYGSTSPDYTPPMNPDAEVLKLDLACSPCFERVCPLGHLRCLTDLTPARVWEAIERRGFDRMAQATKTAPAADTP